MRHLTLALALLSAACTAGGDPQQTFTNRAAVKAPGALFDPAVRSAQVGTISGGTGSPLGFGVCPREGHVAGHAEAYRASLAALRTGASYSRAPRVFATALNTSAARLLVDRDLARAAADVAALRRHAEADAWLGAAPSNGAAASITHALGPLLPAWHILRQTAAATDADRAEIEAWLVRLADRSAGHSGSDNIVSARAANDLMLGLIVGDGARYERGYRGFARQMRTMAADGGFPAETAHTAAPLSRNARNVALLVYAAEIAASNGVDLYATRIGGRSIHDAVGYVLRSADGARAGDEPLGKASRGWILLYTARLPTSEASAALLARVRVDGRFSSETTGGYVSCFAGATTAGKRR